MVLAIPAGGRFYQRDAELNCSPKPRIRCCSASSLTHRVRCISVSVEPGDTRQRTPLPALKPTVSAGFSAPPSRRHRRSCRYAACAASEATVTIARPLATELGHRLLKQVERPADVDREGLLPVFRAQLVGSAHAQDPGGVHQHI